MVGIRGRSGGSNAKPGIVAASTTGTPEPPRQLTKRAGELFQWLVDRLVTDEDATAWRPVDGVLLASVAETLAAEEQLERMLAEDPENDRLLRLRGTYVDRIAKLSGLIGLCPRDRSRQPSVEPPAQAVFDDILARMARG